MGIHKKLSFTRTILDNGLVLLVSENHRVPLVSVNGFVLAGADQNPGDRPGLAAMTASLLDEGTEHYDSHQIAQMIEGAGGTVAIFSQWELSGVGVEMKSDDLSLAVGLIAEMLLRPVFPEDRFQLEQDKVLNQLQAMNDSPQLVANRLFNEKIYQDSPLQYPILGIQESVRKMTQEESREFYRRHYAPQNTILVVAGSADSKEVKDLVERHFGSWQNPDFFRAEMPHLVRQTEPLFEGRYMKREQVNIFVGHLGITRNNPDYYPLQLMDVILGNGPGFTSRIPRKLRDEQGLAYSTYSDISSSSGIYPGKFAAYINTASEKREQALSGLLAEIETLVSHGVTPAEVQMASRYLTGNFVFEFQSNANVARFLLASELFNLGADYLEEYPRIIRSITVQDINRVARQYLDTVNYTTVVVGPTE